MTTTSSGTAPGTPPEAPTNQGPRATRDEIRDLGKLRRTVHDRKVAGVAGGLARHLDIDPVILRVAFVVLAFFGGAGLLLYGAAWALVPEEDSHNAPINLDERSRTIALIGVAALAAMALIGDSWGAFWFPWPLALVALVAFVVLSRRDKTDPADASTPGDSGSDHLFAHTGGGPAQGEAHGAARYAPGPRQRNPRKRGPLLFWFTLALITLGIGVLGTLDVAGLPVADSAYAAVAVGVTGVMLLVGSVYGRGGGLILLGLVSTVALVAATATGRWEGERVFQNPTTAAAVDTEYDLNSGELILDLSDVTDLESLDGRTIRLDGGIGRIEVVLPAIGLDADVRAEIGGPGGVDVFGREEGGVDTRVSGFHDGGADAPTVTIDAELGVGQISVLTEPARSN